MDFELLLELCFVSLKIQVAEQESLLLAFFLSFFGFLQAISKELSSCFYYDIYRLAGPSNYIIVNLPLYMREKISY